MAKTAESHRKKFVVVLIRKAIKRISINTSYIARLFNQLKMTWFLSAIHLKN